MPYIQLQLRRDTQANWAANNPKLAAGEMGLEIETSKFKMGDGNTFWNDLPYGGLNGPVGPTGPQGEAGIASNTGATGPTGDMGPAGIASNTGGTGPTGPIGPTGPAGTASNTGATGSSAAIQETTENHILVGLTPGSSSWPMYTSDEISGLNGISTARINATTIHTIVWAGTCWFAGGVNQNGGAIWRSNNKRDWTLMYSPSGSFGAAVFSMAWNGKVLLAVGRDTNSGGRAWYSIDLAAFMTSEISRFQPTSLLLLNTVIWADGMWVVSGKSDGGDGYLYISTREDYWIHQKVRNIDENGDSSDIFDMSVDSIGYNGSELVAFTKYNPGTSKLLKYNKTSKEFEFMAFIYGYRITCMAWTGDSWYIAAQKPNSTSYLIKPFGRFDILDLNGLPNGEIQVGGNNTIINSMVWNGSMLYLCGTENSIGKLWTYSNSVLTQKLADGTSGNTVICQRIPYSIRSNTSVEYLGLIKNSGPFNPLLPGIYIDSDGILRFWDGTNIRTITIT